MGINQGRITVAYGGTLAANSTIKTSTVRRFLNYLGSYCWTYNNDIIDQSTRSAHSLIQAVINLHSKKLILPEEIHFNFWGNIDKRYQEILEKHGIGQFFTIEGYKSKKDTLAQLMRADILFLPLESSKGKQKPLFIPQKLFEYLQLKKPILILAEKESDCATICLNSNLGLICDPKDHEKLSQLLLDIINKDIPLFPLNPNLTYIETFSFENKTKELVKVFNELLD